MNTSTLKKAFAHLPIPAIKFYQETDSTNTRALNSISDGAQEYSLFAANAQTAGRGRSGRSWVTTAGASIAVSIILHPTRAEQEKLGLFSLLGGLSVQNALLKEYSLQSHVKWPNDVLIQNRKAAGILSESFWQGESLKGVVLGIGINLLPASVPPDENLLFPATCVQNHTTIPVKTERLLVSLMESLISLRKMLLTTEFIDLYQHNLAYLNENIVLDKGNDQLISGILQGIDTFGNICLTIPGTGKQYFPIGDIKLRPQ